MVVFIPGMEEGNFHVQARSKLLVREPEVVPAKALAEMQHGEAVKAPTGPPSLTGEAWLSSAETVANMVSSSKGSEEIVPVRQQANYELNFRSFATKHPQEGKRGHVVDAERDRARCDRRFARSTAQLTPQLFHEEISRRSYNVSTAKAIVQCLYGDDRRGGRRSSHSTRRLAGLGRRERGGRCGGRSPSS